MLGNSTEDVSCLIVKGLPPLELPVGRGGYLDGFIVHATSLRKVFLTRSYEDIYTVALAMDYEKQKPLSQYRRGGLAALRLLNSWARVQILKRTSVSRATVYLVDTGVERDVDISNLYELPVKLRNIPPLAVPIYTDGERLDVDYGDLQRLRGVKVAVKLDEKAPDETICGSEFTVFERDTHNHRRVEKALRDPRFQLDSARIEMKRGEEKTPTRLLFTNASYRAPLPEPNVAAIVIAVLCIVLFLGAVALAVMCLVRSILQKSKMEQHEKEASRIHPRENVPQVREKSIGGGRTEAVIPERGQEQLKLAPMRAIPIDELNIMGATIAPANQEKEKEREMKSEHSQASDEPLDQPDELPGRTVSIPSRAVAGLSELSTIRSQPTPQPRCSTPVLPTNFTPLRPITPRSSFHQFVLPITEDLDASGYSDILDIRQFVPEKTFLDHTIRPADETTFVTASGSPEL